MREMKRPLPSILVSVDNALRVKLDSVRVDEAGTTAYIAPPYVEEVQFVKVTFLTE